MAYNHQHPHPNFFLFRPQVSFGKKPGKTGKAMQSGRAYGIFAFRFAKRSVSPAKITKPKVFTGLRAKAYSAKKPSCGLDFLVLFVKKIAIAIMSTYKINNWRITD